MEQVVNGKFYPMWGQFVEHKDDWIGGQMFDMDSLMGPSDVTEITNVELIPNGKESAMICFRGKDFDLTSDVEFCVVHSPDPTQPEYLVIATRFGSTFYIKQRPIPAG